MIGMQRCLQTTMSRMPKTERDPAGPLFAWRLRAALDRVVPPGAPPRYQSLSTARGPSQRFAPAVLLLAVTGVLALAAFAATGSANPVIWGKQATSVIQAVRTVPAAPPAEAGPLSPAPAAPPRKAPQAALAPPPAEHHASPRPEPSERPVPSPSPEPRESPPPDGGSNGERSPSPSPSPSPTPHDG
jgi:hypothetical protein